MLRRFIGRGPSVGDFSALWNENVRSQTSASPATEVHGTLSTVLSCLFEGVQNNGVRILVKETPFPKLTRSAPLAPKTSSWGAWPTMEPREQPLSTNNRVLIPYKLVGTQHPGNRVSYPRRLRRKLRVTPQLLLSDSEASRHFP